jgi:hypothetical protein
MKMVDHALAYARQGYHVFPVHEPLFKGGVCIGCTCEPYRHSQKCKDTNPRAYLQPGEKCANPGKCPRIGWTKSTLDPATIRQWWGWWPTSNIGIDVGKSGLLVLDRDKYKPEYEELDLSLADTQTITVISGGGGEQLWYAMGESQYTNSPKGLPTGNDIRGKGGYIVAPPSLHKSGRRYTFEDGYGVGEVDTLSIPEALKKILDTANRTIRKPGAQVVPSAIDVKRSMLRAEKVIDLLGAETTTKEWNGGVVYVFTHCPFNPVDDPHGEDRTGNITIGSDGAISAGCHHGRCNDVIADSGLSGWHLLKQMAGVEPKAQPENAFQSLLAQAQEFVKTTNFAPFIKAELQSAKGYLSMETDRAVASALLDLAARGNNFTVYAAYETLRDLAGLGSKSTVKLSLERLCGWFITRNQTAMAHDLAFTYSINIQGILVLRGSNASIKDKAICVRSTQYENRKAEDPFLSGRSRTAKREGLTEAGLGKGLLLLMDVLSDGQGWERLELAEETGKKAGGLGRLLKRGEDLGLLYSEREAPRSPKVYYLSPDCWAKVEALAPTLTTYHLRAERSERELEHEQDRAEVRENMASLPATIAHYAQRRAEIILARRHYLAMIHPDWSPEMVDTWLKTPKPTATPHLDRQEKKFEAEAKNLHKQGITPPQAQAYAERAGWTRSEAASIADRVERLSGGNYAFRESANAR